MNLLIHYAGIVAGIVRVDDKDGFNFMYTKEYLESEKPHPLSLSLPLSDREYTDNECRHFFSNLLPEADIRALISRYLKISPGNDAALLEAIGGECAGAVAIIPEGSGPADEGAYRRIDDSEIEAMLMPGRVKPLLIYNDEMRMSLAGAQDKLPVYIDNGGKLYLPIGVNASSHILKPENLHFPGTVVNEAFCMLLARESGIPVPQTTILKKGKYAGLLIERYDRAAGNDGSIRRVHQEDFCQALGYSSSRKYESDGGPGLKDCFSLINRFSISPLVDMMHLIRWAVYNFIIGNADAHAKNLSIIYREQGPSLAPFYDLVCTKIYPQLSEKMAMRTGQENKLSRIAKNDWEHLADTIGVKRQAVLSTAAKLSGTILELLPDLTEKIIRHSGQDEIILKVKDVIEKHANRLADY